MRWRSAQVSAEPSNYTELCIEKDRPTVGCFDELAGDAQRDNMALSDSVDNHGSICWQIARVRTHVVCCYHAVCCTPSHLAPKER
jgi:hypothetical protein